MKTVTTAAALCVLLANMASADEYLGNYSANENNPNSTSNLWRIAISSKKQ